MHARILSVAVFLPELSTVARVLPGSLANKIPVDTRMHFLYSMFSAPVHGLSAGDLLSGFAYSPIGLQVARYSQSWPFEAITAWYNCMTAMVVLPRSCWCCRGLRYTCILESTCAIPYA